ncbi:MAG: hypothetical protein AAFO75_01170 [Pseudomonadota bacterium]
MADANYPLSADDGLDDLPRTLRREKEARARANQAEAQPASDPGAFGPSAAVNDFHRPPISVQPGYDADFSAPLPSEVTRFNVPFFHLVGFFIKVAFAAIPGLAILGGLIWGAGYLLQTYFPWLVKMQIFIHFPS